MKGLKRSQSAARRYPPMLALAGAMVIVLFTLPSALNLPLANPGQTTEYAPVPGNGNSQAGGNFAGLGLATGGVAAGGGGLADLLLPPGQGIPSDRDCVGKPPRQTEDPLSPPCVGFFRGDNGGATYQGVTRQEVTALFYFDGDSTECTTSRGCERSPVDHYDDLLAPPQSSDDVHTRVLRDWQIYFNKRYQTYNRFVHFWVYYSPNSPSVNTGSNSGYTDSPSDRRADAANNFNKLHPFTAFSYAQDGNADDYSFAMAQRGVLSFGGVDLRSASFYSRFPRLLWGFRPTVEEIAKMYSSYVCTKVVGQPVNVSSQFAGQPRKFGLLRTTDSTHPELVQFGDLVEQQLQACGVNFGGDVMTFPHAGYQVDTTVSPTYATTNMAQFSRDHVTTVLWPVGEETNQSAAADQQQYYPEWITGGDYVMEGNANGAAQDQKEWANARAVTPVVPVPLASPGSRDGIDNPDCKQAIFSVDPGMEADDVNWACSFYEDIRQMMTGIQVAGPRLSPTTVDQGLHAIPPHESPAIYTPACFYDPGDYTCVKDAITEWFDSSSSASNSQGCWRMTEGGQRHIAGRWPPGNVAPANPSDPCDEFPGIQNVDIGPPSTG